jgi:hypothetical protein
MKYIANYAEWITAELMDHLKNSDGDCVPVWQPERWQGNPLLDEFRELSRPGYSNNKHNFQQFNSKSMDMSNFNIEMPKMPKSRNSYHWWFIKLLPGQMQTMHIDPHLVEVKNPVRYTMFLEDFQPGHIFVYDDKMISNYKAGDVFEWSDPMIVHGVVNIGYNTRYTLQITMHD